MNFKLITVLWITMISFSSCEKIPISDPIPIPTLVKKLKWLFLGDSYTIGQSVAEAERYPSYLKAIVEDSISNKKLNITIENTIIAKTGWRTDNLINAIESSNFKDSTNFDLVGLLIGVNNQYQNSTFPTYEIDFNTLLNIAIKKARGKKENVIIVSIPDYAFTPFGQNSNPSKISKELDLYNAKNKELATKNNITYIEITDLSRKGIIDPTLVASDGLHPSGKQYKLWALRMVNKAMELLK